MASGLPKSPRPGRKLTVAVNIPKPSESKRFLEPSMPKSKSPSSHSEMSSSKNKNGPHPPSSPRPSTPKFLQVRSPFGSPDGQGIMRRRHTVSVVEPSKVGVPAAARHLTYPSYKFLDDEPDVGKGMFDIDGVEHEAPNHQPLPASSSFFQQAMLDLKRRPGRTSQSSLDGEDSTLKEIGTPSTRSNHPMRSPPVIEISDIEEKSKNYSLDIEFNPQNDDDDVFGRNGDENKLSSSAPDSFLHETRKSTMLRLQIARAQLSSSEHVLSRPSGKKPKDQLTTLTKKDEKLSAIPKSSRKSKQGALLSVDVSLLGGPLRKWKSTEDSLPSLSSSTPQPGDQHLVHSPFLSPPMTRRKGSVPAVLSTSPKLKQRSSLQDLQSSFKQGEQFGSPGTSNLSPRATTSTKRPSSAHVSSTSRPTWSTSSSLSSASDSSPTPSPRMKHETTEPSVKSNRGQHVSPLSLKTANMITQFITSAAASSSISGSTARKNLLPDTVTLPPVLDSSGRLRVHRRRDDSMRLAKQAVNSDCNDWMDNDDVKRKTKSVMGFAEA